MKQTIFLMTLLLCLGALVACGGGDDNGQAGSANEEPTSNALVSESQPHAYQIKGVETVTSYMGDGDEEQVAAEGRKFVLVDMYQEALDGQPFPLELLPAGDVYLAWAPQAKFRYDPVARTTAGHQFGEGQFAFDVPAEMSSFELQLLVMNNTTAVLEEVGRETIQTP